ncbi:MAG: GTPase RsgA [Firmicutes bacterium]|nr:GTPase RsgA [Bacillota bacterium]
MSKCKGCGITLHSENRKEPGYTPKEGSKLCERCFKITNYNYHEKDSKNIDNNILIKGINNKKCATMFLCDILNLNSNIMEIYDIIREPKVLVITKSDIIPKNIKLNKLEENIKKVYNVDNLLFISSRSGYGKKHVLDYIEKYKKVVLAGPTSSGKSSLINYLFDLQLTVSNHKNTTQEFISLKIGDNEIIDAPGFNEEYLLDNVKQNGFITPKTLIIKKGYSICINNLEFYANQDMNITLFFPKSILVKTRKVKKEYENKIELSNHSDLIVNNLGFIYFKDEVCIYVNDKNYLDTRESIVGGK